MGVYNGTVTPERAGVNLTLGLTGYFIPAFGIPYALTETFVPGGFDSVIASGMEVHKHHIDINLKSN